jgi:hypothetical protein
MKNVTMRTFTMTCYTELEWSRSAPRVFWALWAENAPGELTRLANVKARLWAAQGAQR